MTKSELFERIAERKSYISNKIIEYAVKEMLEYMSISLSKGKRIEIRGFGSFSLHYRSSRIGRNPKTGKKIKLNEKYVPYFKPGKKLRDRVNLYK
ncbi:integration host factor subunit beta [Buchnera aphidicola (Rhopalosiphum padi)]|uniref:Integration host factor subunit beta n=1 Tax=Buchnera aphidicola subsp. Rhopalosiphum padi TaxID=98793 RepID=A0A4D6Y645_BUCRP|nr:integration host factor subunit beta [Buchnera aphidicola]QCI24947.1 integration host factor subunit beta [Buchnera aphidicola (Rhopalosiphum padi)]